MKKYESYEELANAAEALTPGYIDNNQMVLSLMTQNMPTDTTPAKELPPGKYRFVEMPSDGISYKVAAVRVDDNSNKATYIADMFRNKEEAAMKLNQLKNVCDWDGVDPSRMIHIETSKPQDAYENLD